MIHVDCYSCGHYLADNCQGRPDKCGSNYRVAAGNPPDNRPSPSDAPSVAMTPRQQDFERLAEKRMVTFQHQIKLFRNLVGSNYKPSAEQARRLEAAVVKAAQEFTAHVTAYLERQPI